MNRCLHIFISVLSMVLVLFTACGRKLFVSEPTQIAAQWPMFRGDHRHSGFRPVDTSAPYSVLWTYETKGAVISSPIVTSGLIFISSWDKKVHILDPMSGKRIERIDLESSISSTPALSGRRLYVGSEHPHSRLYALDLTVGKIPWQLNALDIYSSPAASNGTVFFGSGDGQIYAVSADSGHVLWTHKTGAPVRSSPAVAHDMIYIGSMDKRIYALKASTGAAVWQYNTGGIVNSSPAIGDSTLYIGSADSTLYALNALSGDTVWTFRTEGAIHASPALDENACYFGAYDGILYALAARTGDLLWRWKTESIIQSSPTVSNNAVFQGVHDGHLYVLDKTDGSLLWKYETGGSISSSPALSSSGIFVGSEDGYVYAFGFQEAISGKQSK